MNNLISQVSHPVFLYLTFVFFLIASTFSFFVGIALALRSKRALKLFDTLNRWVSVRKLMRPLSTPHYIEPTLLKRRTLLGVAIIVGAAVSIALLAEADLKPSLSLFEDGFTPQEISGVASNLKGFLLIGNLLCVCVGLSVLFFPKVLAAVEGYTDRWYTLRKRMLPLDKMHMEVDEWVLHHPTSVGITLSILSLSTVLLMLNQLERLTA
ncbi:MAG: hypothetical protein FD121_243 [Gallionellaceae bacterium]|nr:MAG: hypothetical protein FD121_243 [Gallionellaceae bacterium]